MLGLKLIHVCKRVSSKKTCHLTKTPTIYTSHMTSLSVGLFILPFYNPHVHTANPVEWDTESTLIQQWVDIYFDQNHDDELLM